MRQISPGTGRGLALAAASLLLFCAAAAAESPTLYKWVDKDGHVHYGDTPGGAKAKPINPNVLNNGEDSTIGPVDGKAAADKQAQCQHKTEEFNRFKNAASITETDGLGNTRNYTAEEKDRLVARKQQELNQICGVAGSAPQV